MKHVGSTYVRERYERTFALVLDDVIDAGGVLGADVIDDNPLAHGSLPVNERFESCGLLDNGLDCRQAADEQHANVEEAAAVILERRSDGTDIFGALALAEDFFAAYPEANVRRVVVLSDMVQRGRDLRFPSIGDWSAAHVEELLDTAPTVHLESIEIYVVGVGATASGDLSPTRSTASNASGPRSSSEAAAASRSSAPRSRPTPSRGRREVIGLLIRLVVFLVELFLVAYAVAATVSFLWGLGRFLIAAPGAIRRDLAERRARHPQPERTLRYVANESPTPPSALPPGDDEPPALMPGPSE